MLFARITLQLGFSAAMVGRWGFVERGMQDRETDVETSGAIGYFTRFLTRRTRRLSVCVILKVPFVKVPRSAWCFNFFLPHRSSAVQSALRRSCVISRCSLVLRSTRAGRRFSRHSVITSQDAPLVCQTSSSTCWTMTATRRRPLPPRSVVRTVCEGNLEGYNGTTADRAQNCKAAN